MTRSSGSDASCALQLPAFGEATWSCLPRAPGHAGKALAGALLLTCAAKAAHAQETPAETRLAAADVTQLAPVVVSGRSEHLIGIATAASEGAVAGTDLSVRPLLRTAELLEAVPGLIAAAHSGSGKANQYFLRGFNLDHGTDFSLLVDDVPMNLRTHGHGQGYLDVNGLIPEMVKRVDYRKGPFRADVGDFSLVGTASITTADRFDAPFASFEVGSFGWRRVVTGGSFALGEGALLLGAEAKTYDGPWQLPERLKHSSFYAKSTNETTLGTLRLSASIYNARWRPTEQIPERAIGTLVADEFGSIDPYLQGRTEREIFTIRLDGEDWRASAYAQHYDWNLLSNFTFFLDDPINGDELRQTDKRWTYGGRIERTFNPAPQWQIVAGAEGRYDNISKVGLEKAVAGNVVAARGLFAVKELSAAAYAEATWNATERLRLFAGLRGDAYSFKTTALDGPDAWSGKVSDRAISPKAGVSYVVADGLAIYGNWGRGFHSNDARGVTAPTSPAPGLAAGAGREVGLRLERDTLVATATVWGMDVSSDLIYVGDSGAVEPTGATKRHGYELTAFWRPKPWMTVDAVWTGSSARYTNAGDAGHVPGALESAGELGLAAILPEWNASMRVRYLGPHALIADNSIRAEPVTLVNFRAAWTPKSFASGKLEVYGELLNAFGSRGKDVDYIYASRLPGEPPEGVEGLHSRVVEPRSVRVGVKLRF